MFYPKKTKKNHENCAILFISNEFLYYLIVFKFGGYIIQISI